MKKLLYSILAVSLFAACGESGTSDKKAEAPAASSRAEAELLQALEKLG